MNDVNKNLGHATAYGYAKSKGYTGTEEEFAELMADYAEVGERAEAAATAAAASATAASGSASDSAASATAAEGFAGNASTAAGNASQAATQATGSATAADTAKTAAQAAQTAAETAAEDAETAAASVAGKSEQIDQNTEDISLLQSDLDAMSTASASDEGKALIAKTVTDGKVTEWEFGEAGGGGGSPEIVCNASGAVASFADGADGYAVKELSVALEPIQDLHGQANPYPAGGGANKLNPDFSAFDISGIYACQLIGTGAEGESVAFRIFDKGNNADISGVYLGTSALGHSSGGTGGIQWAVSNGGIETSKISQISTQRHYISFYPKTEATLAKILARFNIQAEVSDTEITAYAPYSNICPISGRQSVTVTRAGVNVYDEEWENGYYNASGNPVDSSTSIRSKNYISVKPNTTYYIKSDTAVYIGQYDAEKNVIGSQTAKQNATFTTDATTAYIRINTPVATYGNNISINYPSTDHGYHPGTVASVDVQLGQTVYGGTVDTVSGVLTVGRAKVVLDGSQSQLSEGWRPNAESVGWLYPPDITPGLKNLQTAYSEVISDTLASIPYGTIYASTGDQISLVGSVQWGLVVRMRNTSLTTKAAIDAYLSEHPIIVVYPLETPLTVQLVGQSMTTLKGQNNIWSDGGNVSVDYVADTKLFIEQLTEPDADMIADANITSGKYFMVGNQLFLATANIASGAAIVPGVNCTRTNLAAALNAINS